MSMSENRTKAEPRKLVAYQWDAKVLKGLAPKMLYNADPDCMHDIEALWSGIKCRNCPAWYCA